MYIARLRPGLAGLLLALFASVAGAQDKPTVTATVSGFTVNLQWTVVPGATTYELVAQTGGTTFGPIGLGGATQASIPNVPAGTYILAVRGAAGAVKGPFSDPVTAVVGTLTPPAAPTGLTATISNLSAGLSWNLNNPAGSLSAVQLRIGQSPGIYPITIPLPASASSYFIPSAPAGTYYATVVAIGAGGVSGPSNELILTLPGCTAPSTIPLNATSVGAFVDFSWPQLPGAAGYSLIMSATPGGPSLAPLNFPPTQTSFSYYGVPQGTYYVTLRSTLSCGQSVSSTEQVLTVTPPVKGPPLSRSAATALALQAVNAVTAANPGDLQRSCGNHTWLFKVAQWLRNRDIRYGLMNNYTGGMSHDIIAYNHSEQPDDQVRAPHLYAWDTIAGHCGPNPSPWAQDITNPNGVAQWTITEYLKAGYRP